VRRTRWARSHRSCRRVQLIESYANFRSSSFLRLYELVMGKCKNVVEVFVVDVFCLQAMVEYLST